MNNNVAEVAKKYRLKLVVLFGSAASGRTRPTSDVDILVAPTRRLSYEEEDELRTDIAAALKVSEDKLDLVSSWRAGGLLLTEALEKGKLLFGDEIDFVQERVRAARKFRDEEHFRKRRHEFLARTFGH
jgi:predicted nucleotidyltransferase